MKKIEIEHGIPIPPDLRGRRTGKYPFDKMRVGDSILIPRNSRQSAYYYRFKHPDFRFTVRRVGENYRLWRTER
jgi:hypothetical protein